jgi:Flp pilus assembly protein TadG
VRASHRVRAATLTLLRGDGGAVLAEFALVVPIMALVMCAIIDFSMAMFTLNNLTIAVREGGRFAAVQPTIATNDPAVIARVDQAISQQFNAPAGGYTVTVTPQSTTPPIGNITVQISGYQYVPVTPMAPLFGMSTVPMGRRAVFRSERTN